MLRTPVPTGSAFARASLLLLSTVLLLSACKPGAGEAQAKAEEDKKGADAVPVEVAKVARHPVAASYTGTAALEPRAESQVVAKTSGVALTVLAEEGQAVKAGQTLVTLDADRARLAVAQTEAQLRKLENNYNRSQQLAAQQLISANENEQLRYDLANIRAQYNLMKLELSYTSVEAPISGVIASRSIKPGNFVQINTPIFRIVDNSRLEATLNVPERELATLKAGLPVTLQVDALPGKSVIGVVDRVAPVVDSGSGTFRVVSRFDGDSGLQPGMFGRLRIDYDQRANALVVPRLALLDNEGDPSVYVVRDGKAVRVRVALGYTDGGWVEVRDGVTEGDSVVTAGKAALRDGTQVQVLQNEARASASATKQPAKDADKAAEGKRQ